MPNYIVVTGRVAYGDGEVANIGDKITLSERHASGLLASRVIRTVEDLDTAPSKTPGASGPTISDADRLQALKRASVEQLKSLPGIGDAKAKALFDANFNSLEQARTIADLTPIAWEQVTQGLDSAILSQRSR